MTAAANDPCSLHPQPTTRGLAVLFTRPHAKPHTPKKDKHNHSTNLVNSPLDYYDYLQHEH